MPIRFFGPAGGTAYGIDADVLLWKAAVEANGGSVTLTRLQIVNTFVVGEKDGGSWALTDDYWCFWAENAIQALTSLKQRRLATTVNAPTFTADRDYSFDGLSNYINTGFIPSTNGVNYTANNQRIAVYPRTNVSSIGTAAGVADGSGVAAKILINPRNGSNMTGGVNTPNAFPATFAISPADSRGLKVVSRAGGTTALGFDRGVRLTDATGLSVTSGAVTRALYMGCFNSVGTPSGYRSSSLGFANIGGPLTNDAMELGQYTRIQAWATAVGANV